METFNMIFLRLFKIALSYIILTIIASSITHASNQSDQNVVIGMQLEPPNLDPTGGSPAAAIDEVVYANLFEGLTRFGPDGSINPGLAASWNISQDGSVYIFNLRDNVNFHDGTQMNAKDVKFSLDRARADQSTNAQKTLFKTIKSVDIIDPLTVKVTLKRPNGSFLFNMAWGDAVIVAPESAKTNAINPIGTGPFIFKNWIKGDSVTLSRNQDYWGKAVRLESVTFKFISDPTAAFAAIMAEDIDAFPTFPAPENLAQLSTDPRFKVIVGSTEGETILAINNKKPPLDNIKIRQAITHAIDRQAIIDGAMFGYGTPIGTHFAPHHPDYIDLTAQSEYNPLKTKALLEEAGADDLTLNLKLPPPSYARRGGEIIASQLRDVGIRVEIINLEWAQWLEQVFRGKDFELTIVSHTEPFDIGIYARDDYYFQYDDKGFKKIIDDLADQSDPQKRSRLIKAAQKKIADDAVNGYLFQLAKTGVARAKLKGLWPNSPTQANDMTGVYWAK